MYIKKTNYLLAFSVLTGIQSYGQQTINDLSEVQFGYQPNILWISVEDISCNLVCYGDSTVKTPNIDRLASEGVVFENAYSTFGVCAPSRSSIITGMYPTHIGTANMRTYGIDIPEETRSFTAYMREAGYYCTNNPKEDYNFTTPEEAWDESGFTAHYHHRKDKNQPFFAVYNILACHESQIWGNAWEHLTVEPDSVRVPLYYPQDNDIIKKDIARKYANIELMDLYVGQKLRMLEDQGILDSTIVVFWSDHGGVLPRQKREATNTGLKVPFIIRFPNKSLAGTRDKELVSLMDLGPTMLSLIGLPKPPQMHGKAIAGKEKEEPRKYSFGAANRMDESNDLLRSVTDGRYRYVRNYYPEYPGFKYIAYRFNMRMMKEMYRLQKADELSGFAHDWFLPNKPIEELYDTKTDPDEVVNLADKPNHADKLKELRSALMDWQDSIADVCLMPEGELYAVQAAYNMPVTDFILQNKSYYKRIQTTANQSLYPKKNIDILIAALTDTIPSVRYWAIRGIGRLGANDKAYLPKLIALKNDPSHAVQVSLAWALSEMGNNTESLAIYRKLLRMKREEQPESDILHYNKMLAINDLTYNLYLAEKLKPELKQIASIKKYKLPLAAENVLKILETKNK